MKVGVLGGTFDPVHEAHLAIARVALAALALDKLLWMPTGAPRYRSPAVASGEHRLAMLRIALGAEPRYEIDARELAPGASGYTVDTLKGLRGELGLDAELWLLLGADQYAKLGSWHKPEEVARLARIAVFARPGWDIGDARVASIPFDPMPISASEVRARVKRGESIAGLVPESVANYIVRHGLYR